MQIDIVTLATIAIIGFLLVGFIQSLIKAYAGKPKRIKTLEPTDFKELQYKQYRIAGKLNRREIKARLRITGDGAILPTTFKISGYIASASVISFFWRPSFWTLRPKWVLVPTDLCFDLNSKLIRIRCRGFEPRDEMYWVPTYCAIDAKKIPKYNQQITDFLQYIDDYFAMNLSSQNRLTHIATGAYTEHIPDGYYRGKDALYPLDQPQPQTDGSGGEIE